MENPFKYLIIALQFFFAFLIYIILAIFVSDLIVSISLIFDLPLPEHTTSLIIGIGALAGLAGVIHARIFSTTRYTIDASTYPASWRGKKIVLVSDLHFGYINHKKFGARIIQKIKSLQPDIIFVPGDVYDGPTIETGPITEIFKELGTIAPVFYSPGNHEHYGPYEKYIQSLRDSGATVLINESIEHDGVTITGIQYYNKNEAHIAKEKIAAAHGDTALPKILLNHPPTFVTEAADLGYSLMVSGHTHAGQFWPNNFTTWLVYGKYNYGKHTYKELTTITTRGVGTSGIPTRLFRCPEFVVIDIK